MVRREERPESRLEAYRVLEAKMEAMTLEEGSVFVRNPTPSPPVDYVLVAMEPSLGRMGRSVEEGRARVAAGFRNFLCLQRAGETTSCLPPCFRPK